jgi:6-phosphogluconolactonase (cycloisomerase 2 family)
MTLRLKLMLLVAVTLTIKASFAQARTDQPDEAAPATTSTPAAYVYVANLTNPNATATNKYVYEIYAFAAAANGKLTPVPGSPFKDSLGFMEVNGKYLFGETYYLGNYISSYSIESNGALKLASKIDAQKYNPGGCGVMGPLGLDHTGTVLYNTVNFGDCTQAAVQSYEIESKTGALKYLESSGQIPYGADNLAFLGNNHVAYAAACFPVEMEEGGQVLGFERHSDGVLTVANINTPEPQPRLSSDDYCPGVIATDPINHMAIALQEADLYGDPNGKPVLSTFTADDNGNLTTTSSYKNMPEVDMAAIYWIRMSPSGKLLAVAGSNGLQVFHYNGGAPITKYTGLLNKGAIAQCFWDNENHLYAIGENNAGTSAELFVYTVTETNVTEAPGSPYAIPTPVSMAVQAK